MTKDLVSVLIPCFNAEQYIRQAIDSVLEQSWPHIEIIVVDDGSADASVSLVETYAPRGVRLIRQKNAGAAAARNRALSDAQGTWCLFLDADDGLERHFIESQVQAATAANADICFGCSVLTWPDGRRLEKQAMPRGASMDMALGAVLTDGWHPPNAILWRTAYIRAIGAWDEQVRRNDDGELIARALLRDPVITSSSGSRAIYRQHPSPDRVSARKDRSAVQANLDIAANILAAVEKRQDMPIARAGATHSLTMLAYEAFSLGHYDVGRQAEKLARRAGPLKHEGTWLHEFACSTIGAENKARLSRLLHRARGHRIG